MWIHIKYITKCSLTLLITSCELNILLDHIIAHIRSILLYKTSYIADNPFALITTFTIITISLNHYLYLIKDYRENKHILYLIIFSVKLELFMRILCCTRYDELTNIHKWITFIAYLLISRQQINALTVLHLYNLLCQMLWNILAMLSLSTIASLAIFTWILLVFLCICIFNYTIINWLTLCQLEFTPQ